MPDFSLGSRNAVVCGASSGIGAAVAEAFVRYGAKVCLVARREGLLQKQCDKLNATCEGAASYVVADLENLSGMDALVNRIHDALPLVNILVNNAGGPEAGLLKDMDVGDFATGFQRHVLASHRLTQYLLPDMIEARYGRILNIISTSVREPILRLGVSNTIRGAMAGWAKSMANELPPGITINNILPGLTDTERLASLKFTMAEQTNRSPEKVEQDWLASIPEGRLAQPDELATTAVFLASSAGAYIRGVSLPVDGGRLKSI